MVKEYTFQVTITEGYDEFWDDINERKVTGIDDVLLELKRSLEENFTNSDAKFLMFKEVDNSYGKKV